MTKQEDMMRIKGRRGQTYEQRFPRYIANALTEAQFARGRASASSRAASFSRSAGENARDHGDTYIAELYAEVAEAQEDIADAQEDIVRANREIAAAYTRKMTEDPE
jgi:hypothetical protein